MRERINELAKEEDNDPDRDSQMTDFFLLPGDGLIGDLEGFVQNGKPFP